MMTKTNANATEPTIDLPADTPAWVRREAEAAWRRFRAGEDVPPMLLGCRVGGRTKRLVLHVNDAAAQRHAARHRGGTLGGGDAA